MNAHVQWADLILLICVLLEIINIHIEGNAPK